MKRILPDTKKKTFFLLGLTARDLLVVFIGVLLLLLVLMADLDKDLKLGLVIGVAVLTIISVVTFDIIKGYQFLYRFIGYLTRKKRSKARLIGKSTGMEIGEFIKVKNTSNGTIYTAVIELNGIDFSVLDEQNQDGKINIFADIIKNVKSGKIVKLEKHIDFNKYITENESYLTEYATKISADCVIENKDLSDPQVADAIDSLFTAKPAKPQEVFSKMSLEQVKSLMLSHQNDYMEHLNDINRVYQEAFYFVIQDANKGYLAECVDNALSGFSSIGLCPVQLQDTEKDKALTKFLMRFFSTTKDIDDIETLRVNQTREKMSRIKIGDRNFKVICCHKYKMFADNCWGWSLFRIPETRVVFNFRPYHGKDVNRLINKVLLEITSQLNDPKVKGTDATKLSGDYQVMEALMKDLEFGNDTLFDTELYIIYPEEHHKKVMKQIRSMGVVINDMYLNQYDAYVNTFPFNLMPEKSETICHMPSSSAAALFPFVIKQLSDDQGFYIGGSSGLPVFFDPFYRDDDRVNSNICVFGKSGSGKSYFLKNILKTLAALDKRIFILDPDNEYSYLCKVFKGNFIDVSGGSDGIINPLQVFPAFDIDDDDKKLDGDDKKRDEVTEHQIFLEAFFKTILPNITPYGAALLKKYIKELYQKKKINEFTYKNLKVEDYPILEDLNEYIKTRLASVEKRKNVDPFERQEHNLLVLYMDQFAHGGLYSKLWNGYTTLEITNNFNVLNFQSLFAQSNTAVANAQMLLVVKFLNQEVIKNREEHKNNIVIGIDEAHRFINPEYPVALNFMKDMAKQVRKYYGSLIVATQSVDDFIGVSESMKSRASAVINSCQYSFIFGLLPDDINKMKDLYKNYSGGFTKSEIDYITSSKQGDCLFVVDYKTRLPIHITAYPGEEVFFLDHKAKQKISKKNASL